MLKDSCNYYLENRGMFFKVSGSGVIFFGTLEGCDSENGIVIFKNVHASDESQLIFPSMNIPISNITSIDGEMFTDVQERPEFKLTTVDGDEINIGETVKVVKFSTIYDGTLLDIGVDAITLKDVECSDLEYLEGGGTACITTHHRVAIIEGQTFEVNGKTYCSVIK